LPEEKCAALASINFRPKPPRPSPEKIREIIQPLGKREFINVQCAPIKLKRKIIHPRDYLTSLSLIKSGMIGQKTILRGLPMVWFLHYSVDTCQHP
jgi:hypothetical protein